MAKPEYIPYQRPSGDPQPMRGAARADGKPAAFRCRTTLATAAPLAAPLVEPVTMTPAAGGAGAFTDGYRPIPASPRSGGQHRRPRVRSIETLPSVSVVARTISLSP